MTAQQQLAPGTTLGGKYRLLSQIGKGGMGTVWEAVELKLNRRVALKVIKPRGKDGKPSTTAVGRFLREFRAMSRLRSPHVVTVYDHGSDDDRVYISMELLTGSTLRSRIKGGVYKIGAVFHNFKEFAVYKIPGFIVQGKMDAYHIRI